MKGKKKIIYATTFVILIIIVTFSITYAYFSAIANSDNDIKGSTLDVKLDLKVKQISSTGSKSAYLVPIYDGSIEGKSSQLETAATEKYNCVDTKGYTVCQIYEVTIYNNGTDDTTVDTLINFDKKEVNNLKWASMSDANTVISGQIHDITTNVDATITSNIKLSKNSSSKVYFMVYVNNVGNSQLQQDKDDFTAKVIVSAATGEKIQVTFNE